MSVRQDILTLKSSVAKEIIGQEEIVERLILGLLANGNLLVESLPGLAKTRAINTLAGHVEGDFNRIQFTPDLRSTDVSGKEEWSNGEHKFVPGPIFSNIILADEINRSPPKTQNALLEAMEERQVTTGSTTRKLPELFMVMATMNPATQQGTFPLLEAQMDRFLMHVLVDYPDEKTEGEIIRLIRKETSQDYKKTKDKDKQRHKLAQETLFDARGEIDKITVPDHVEKYMVDLVFATRYPQRYTFELKSFIAFGVSPRASLALDRVARAHAWINDQKQVEIENIEAVLHSVFRHRLTRGDRAIEHSITTHDICDEILSLVPRPDSSAKPDVASSA